MSARFEIVRTDAGWHSRYVAGNNEIVMQQEPVTRRQTAINAARSLARTFHPKAAVVWIEAGLFVSVVYVTEVVVRVPLRFLDERTTDRSRPEGDGSPGVTGAQPDEPASQADRPASGGAG